MFVCFLACLLACSLVVRLFLDAANISSSNNKCSLVRLRPGGWGMGTPMYGLYKHVPRDMLWFLRF